MFPRFQTIFVLVSAILIGVCSSFQANLNRIFSANKLANKIASGILISFTILPIPSTVAVESTTDLVSQLKVLQQAQEVLDSADLPYIELPSKIAYREFREGRGTETVKAGSLVATEMTVRCESFKTQQEPGGVKYFSTKIDTPNNELRWVIGSGELLPGKLMTCLFNDSYECLC